MPPLAPNYKVWSSPFPKPPPEIGEPKRAIDSVNHGAEHQADRAANLHGCSTFQRNVRMEKCPWVIFPPTTFCNPLLRLRNGAGMQILASGGISESTGWDERGRKFLCLLIVQLR